MSIQFGPHQPSIDSILKVAKEKAAKEKGELSSSADWTKSEDESLPAIRQRIAEGTWEKFSKGSEREEGLKRIEGLKEFLVKNSREPERMRAQFEEAFKERNFSKILHLFDSLDLNQLYEIDFGERLYAINPGPVSRAERPIAEDDVRGLKKYIDDTDFSGVIVLSDRHRSYTIHSDNLRDVKSPIFAIHSLGKVFTGVLVMLMIKTNIITREILNEVPVRLDPAIKKYLSVHNPRVMEQLAKVSLRQLLHHQASLGDYLTKYQNAIHAALKEGRQPPALSTAADFVAFADDNIEPNNYSNLGLLLAGLSIEQHYNQRFNTHLTFEDILKKELLDPLGISLAVNAPENARYNPGDPSARYIAGSPGGGAWTTAENVAALAKYVNDQCRKDSDFFAATNEFGDEFYAKDERVLAHAGFIDSSSAHVASFLDNGVTVSILSDRGQFSALRVYHAIVRNILHP